MAWLIDSLKWANDLGIWDLVQTIVLVGTLVIGVKFLIFPKRRVRNLNYFTQISRDHPDWPLRLLLEVRNYTGKSLVISSPFFTFRDLRPDPKAHADSLTGEYEIKFPDPANQQLNEVESFIRHKESVQTWIPLDQSHSDEDVRLALSARRVGTFTCTCTWLEEKPYSHKLVRKI